MMKKLTYSATMSIGIISFLISACSGVFNVEPQAPNMDEVGQVISTATKVVQNAEDTNPQTSTDTSSAAQTIDLSALAKSMYPENMITFQLSVRQEFNSDYSSFSREGVGQVDLALPGYSYSETWTSSSDLGTRGSQSEVRRIADLTTSLGDDTCSMTTSKVFGPESGAFSLDLLPNPGSFLSGEAALVESDMHVNDRISHRYELTDSNFSSEDAEMVLGFQGLISGDLYLDAETGSVVKIALEISGKEPYLYRTDSRIRGRTYYEFNIFGYGEPVEIEALDECGALPETPFPFMEEGLIVYQASLSGESILLVYRVPYDQVVDFFETELQMAGWKLIDRMSFRDREIDLELSDDEGGTLSVTISENAPKSATEEDSIFTNVHIVYINFGF